MSPRPRANPPGAEDQQALSIRDEWKQPLADMQPGDVIEVGISLERMRRRTPIGWLQSLALGVCGSGLGAYLAGSKGIGVWAALFLGGGVWLGLLFAEHERTVSAKGLCEEFLRLVDRWPIIGGHAFQRNSDYIRAIVTQESPSVRTRLDQLMHGASHKETT